MGYGHLSLASALRRSAISCSTTVDISRCTAMRPSATPWARSAATPGRVRAAVTISSAPSPARNLSCSCRPSLADELSRDKARCVCASSLAVSASDSFSMRITMASSSISSFAAACAVWCAARASASAARANSRARSASCTASSRLVSCLACSASALSPRETDVGRRTTRAPAAPGAELQAELSRVQRAAKPPR
eukprot:scaffold33875_cov27-Tisochrysis_lutea.AAC.2